MSAYMTPRERLLADIGLIALRNGTTRQEVFRKNNRCPKARKAMREAALMLIERGRKIPDVARILRRNHSTIYYILDKVQKHGKTASQSRFAGNDNGEAGEGNIARSGQ